MLSGSIFSSQRSTDFCRESAFPILALADTLLFQEQQAGVSSCQVGWNGGRGWG